MNIFIMLLLISFLVLVHELGHFLSARFFKIKVEKFGFGLPIGPTLWKGKWGETEILVHAFLMGGYISFPDDEKDCDLPNDSPERFANKPLIQRAIVVSAGVIANMICAFLLILLTAVMWGKLPADKANIYVKEIYTPKIIQNAIDFVTFNKVKQIPIDDFLIFTSKIYENSRVKQLETAVYKCALINSSTINSGLKKYDIIDEINNQKIIYPAAINRFSTYSRLFDDFSNEKTIKKKLAELKLKNPNLKETEIIKTGTKVILPDFTPENPLKLSDFQMMGVEKYLPEGVKLNQIQINLRNEIYQMKYFVSSGQINLKDVAIAISDTYSPINIKVYRNDNSIQIKSINPGEFGKIGIVLGYSEIFTQTKTPVQIINESCKYTYNSTKNMLIGLKMLCSGKIPFDNMNSIVAVTKIGGDIIEHQGIFRGILLTAIISINLAIINILPIPALDGGHLFFMLIEKITGRPVNEKVVESVSNLFFMLLILLMILLLYNDIHSIITHKI